MANELKSLLQNIIHDLRTTLLPSYTLILTLLLDLLPRSSIPAETLIVLLETLARVFRHLLVPSLSSPAPVEGEADGEDLLQLTWSHFLHIIPRCDPEVRRGVGEVLGTSVLRRTKGPARVRVVRLLLGTEGQGEGVGEVAAWSLVCACKVSPRLNDLSIWLVLTCRELFL